MLNKCQSAPTSSSPFSPLSLLLCILLTLAHCPFLKHACSLLSGLLFLECSSLSTPQLLHLLNYYSSLPKIILSTDLLTCLWLIFGPSTTTTSTRPPARIQLHLNKNPALLAHHCIPDTCTQHCLAL